MNLRSCIYDTLIRFTDTLYAEVFDRLPQNAKLLDIGIGTGAPIAKLASVVRAKNIRIHGIDIDQAYLRSCTELMRAIGLEAYVTTEYASAIEYAPAPTYDAVYFSNSFMIIPPAQRQEALLQAIGALSETGHRCIYFTQTHEHRHSAVMNVIKPLLKYITTINFGRVTYEHEFANTLAQSGLRIQETKVVFANRSRTIVLVVTRPIATP